jgi:hypothetical protein
MWDLWWTNRHWSGFPPGTSVSPAKNSAYCSTVIMIIIHHHLPGLADLDVIVLT